MSGDKMEVELAAQKLKTMEHSEQHYFKRYVSEPWEKEKEKKSTIFFWFFAVLVGQFLRIWRILG